MKLYNYFIFAIILLSLSCNTKEPTLKLIVHLGCSDDEAVADIRYSVNSLNEFLKNNSIKVEYANIDSTCGYELKIDDKVKFIDGAMTDIELEKECVSFFPIRSK